MADAVRDIMTKNVVTIDIDVSALNTAKIMNERAISSVIVLKEGKPVGIITERDFIKKICSKDLPVGQLKASEIMSKIITTADPDTSIEIAVQRMINHKIRRLPVVEGDKIVGIITVTDLAKYLRTTLLIEGALRDTQSIDSVIATMDHEKH